MHPAVRIGSRTLPSAGWIRRSSGVLGWLNPKPKGESADRARTIRPFSSPRLPRSFREHIMRPPFHTSGSPDQHLEIGIAPNEYQRTKEETSCPNRTRQSYGGLSKKL